MELEVLKAKRQSDKEAHVTLTPIEQEIVKDIENWPVKPHDVVLHTSFGKFLSKFCHFVNFEIQYIEKLPRSAAPLALCFF